MNKKIKKIQRDVILPTGELIKIKGSDFRVLSIISMLGEVENNRIRGEKYIYTSHESFNKNINWICKILNMKIGQVLKRLRNLLKYESDEFCVVEKEVKDKKQYFYKIKCKEYKFVNIPYEKLETMVTELDSNCIKLYCNLLLLCVEDGKFIEKQLRQQNLLELIGLSEKSIKIIKSTTDKLVKYRFIKVRRYCIVDEEISNDISVVTTQKGGLYYSIVFEK